MNGVFLLHGRLKKTQMWYWVILVFKKSFLISDFYEEENMPRKSLFGYMTQELGHR